MKATQEVVHGGRVRLLSASLSTPVDLLKVSPATLGITYCIVVFLSGIVVFAYPTLRSRRHNSFESEFSLASPGGFADQNL